MNLVQKLQLLRKDLVERCGTTSFMIFKDEELKAIASSRPKTIDELCKIKGFPKKGKRVQAYGEAIIKCVNGEDDFVLEGNGENVITKMKRVEF